MTGSVLITGATGFAGSFLVELYASRGWTVHGTFRDPIEDPSWIPSDVHLHEVDLLDRPAVRELMGDVMPAVVHHLAAQSSVAASWQDPMGTLMGNSAAQFNVLESIGEVRPDARVLVVGSCDEYGDVLPEDNPITESHQLQPSSPYALSKVVQDLMARQYATRAGPQVIRVRPFLQIGPRRQPQFVAGSFARQIAEIEAGLREPVIDVGNIDLARDFTDVRDMARAYAAAVDGGVAGDVYNIASGKARTIRELLDIMVSMAGVRVEVRTQPSLLRAGEMPVLVGDASKLRHLTGWSPAIPFEQSAQDTLAYWRARVREAFVMEGNAT